MKKLLLSMICVTAVTLCGMSHEEREQEIERIHRGVTPEETRQIIRSSFELKKLGSTGGDIAEEFGKRKSDYLGYDSLPVFYEMLEETDDPSFMGAIVCSFYMIDGNNLASEGDSDALERTRRIIDARINAYTQDVGFMYLVLKGGTQDIEFMSQRQEQCDAMLKGYYIPLLATRASGTNIFGGARASLSVHEPPFIPSIANTGSQAVYVYEILKRYMEQEVTPKIPAEQSDSQPTVYEIRENHEIRLENGYASSKPLGGTPRKPSKRDSRWNHWNLAEETFAKMPDELLTMVVSFDEDGNPVSSVDLAKYGLSMPIIFPKPDKRNRGKGLSVAFPHDAEGWTPPPFTAPIVAILPKVDDTPEEKPATPQEVSSIVQATEKPIDPVPPRNKNLRWLGFLALVVFGGVAVWQIRKR